MGKRPSDISPCGQQHLRAVVTLTHNAANSSVRTKLFCDQELQQGGEDEGREIEAFYLFQQG